MIISFSGKSQAGKDTAALELINNHGFEKLSISAVLKELCAEIFNIPFNNFEEQGIKDQTTQLMREVEDNEAPHYGANYWYTHRDLTIMVGQACKNVLGNDIWINIVEQKIKNNPDKNYVVTDLRFPVEYDLLKKYGSIVRIEREGIDKKDVPSETALDDYKFDVILRNNGTIEDLHNQVSELYGKLK